MGLIVSSITMHMSAANTDSYLSRLLTGALAVQEIDINKCGHGILSFEDRVTGKRGRHLRWAC